MNHGPKPLIEEHYHIQELIDRQQKRVDDREYHRNKLKESEERNDLIRDTKPAEFMDFWCDGCKEDFRAVTVKQVEIDWTNTAQYIAFYKTKCFCGKWCIRLITDKFKDAYWSKSKLVALDRGRHFKDTVQPYETGFNLLYGKK